MRLIVKPLMRDESGRAMTLALVLLVVGGLILPSLLGFMSAGLTAGQVNEKKTHELYAADAGVENGIWYLQQGGDPDDGLNFTLNGKAVVVEMDELPHECYETAIYEIVSTATSADGSSTTVLADVTNIYVLIETGQVDYGEIIAGSVYASGDLFVDSEAQIQGNAIVGGDLILNECSLVGGVVCVGGDLTLNEGAEIESDLYIAGNLLMMGGGAGSWVDGTVYVMGNVEMQGQAATNQTLWSGSNLTGGVQVDKKATIMEGVHVRFLEVASGSGTYEPVYEDYYDHYCPLGFTDPEVLVWVII
jgi:hypothetical protein